MLSASRRDAMVVSQKLGKRHSKYLLTLKLLVLNGQSDEIRLSRVRLSRLYTSYSYQALV